MEEELAPHVERVFGDESLRATLVRRCRHWANMYNATNEGSYRMKYNLLYPLLFHTLEPAIKLEFFASLLSRLESDVD